MADLKTRIGPKHDPQAPCTNKVWVNPTLVNSRQSPLSVGARTNNYLEAPRENHTPSPKSGQLSLFDRLNISPESSEVNQNDSVKYAGEGRSKSLLERVWEPQKASTSPLPSPKQNATDGRHLTPNSTIAETASNDGRVFTKSTQDITSSNNVSEDTHEDTCNHVSFPLPYKNGINAETQPIPSSPGAPPSRSRDPLSITPSARSTPRPTSQTSLNPLINRLSPAIPAQGTPLPQTIRSAALQEPGLTRSQTLLPLGADGPIRKDTLTQIRDKLLPIVQKNATARTSAITGSPPSHPTPYPIGLTAISDDSLKTFAQRSSEVNRELLARGISTLPPKPTQIPEKMPVERGVDPIRRISKDFSNDNPSSSRIAKSHSRHGSTEDRRMATGSPLASSSHARLNSTDSLQRFDRSPLPPHWRGSTTGPHRRSQSPSMFRERNSSEDLRRYTKSPPRHSRKISTDHTGPLYSQSPSRFPERSASPRRRSSFASRIDDKSSPERYPHRRSHEIPLDMNSNASERYRHNDSRPRGSERGADAPDVRLNGDSLTPLRSNQSPYHSRRDSIHSRYSPSRRNWEKRSNSPYMRRRSASPRPHNHADRSANVDTRGSSSGHIPDAYQNSMQPTADVAPSDQVEAHRPAESFNAKLETDDQPGLMEDTQHANTLNDIPPGDPLPCHNVPGIWFAEFGQPSMSTKICAFQIDGHTAQQWNIRGSDSQRRTKNAIKKLSLKLCCIAKKEFEEFVGSLVGMPDSSPRQIASAIFGLEKKWPPQGKLIITLNPDTAHKHVWLPHQIEPDYVSIQDFVREGQNIVQLVQLSDLSDFVFVLYATDNAEPTENTPTSRPLSNDQLRSPMTNGSVTISPL